MKKRDPKEPTPSQNRIERLRPSLLLTIVAAVAIVARVVYFIQLKNNSPVYERLIHDSALFNELAHRVLDHGLVLDTAFYISPLYIYFLALVYELFGDAFNTVRLIQFVLGMGTAVFTAAIALQLFNKRVALVAGLMAAVYAPFLFFEGNLLGTSVVTFMLVLAFYLLTLRASKRLVHLVAFFVGIVLALAITGRPNLLLLTPLPVGYFILNNRKNRKLMALASAVYLLGLSVPLLLTGLHNKKAGGEFVLLTTHGGINFYIGNHEKADGAWRAPEGIEASVSAINLEQSKAFAERELGRSLTASEVSAFWYKKGLDWGLRHPILWLKLLGKKFLMFWSAYETPLNFDYYFHQKYSGLLKIPLFNLTFYMPLVITGLLLLIKKIKELWLVYGVILFSCLSIVLFFMADRYRVVIVPFMILMAAAAVFELMALFKERRTLAWLYSGLFLLLLFVQVSAAQERVRQSNFANDYYNLALSYLIDENAKSSIYWGQRAAVADPSNANTHYNLGVAYLKLKEYDQALDSFETVLELDPESAGANRSVGAILLMKQRYYRAKRLLTKANELEPDNPQCLMNLGLAHYYSREFQKAIDTWRRLEELEPQNKQVKNNIKAAEYALERR